MIRDFLIAWVLAVLLIGWLEGWQIDWPTLYAVTLLVFVLHVYLWPKVNTKDRRG